jgi:transposase-like protein
MLRSNAEFINLHLFIESEMKKRKVKVGASTRLDETYIKEKGIWCYLYRAVDKLGNTVDFLLTRKRQRMSAQSFLIKAISNNYKPRIITLIKAVLVQQRSKSITSVRSQRLKSSYVNILTMLSNRAIVLSGGSYKTD